jgi:hypothetical protein
MNTKKISLPHKRVGIKFGKDIAGIIESDIQNVLEEDVIEEESDPPKPKRSIPVHSLDYHSVMHYFDLTDSHGRGTNMQRLQRCKLQRRMQSGIFQKNFYLMSLAI